MNANARSLTSSPTSLSGWPRRITEGFRHLFGPSGGLSYHISALRNRPLWWPFLKRVSSWLEEWRPVEKKLLLIGPSAGWSLPASFLQRFDSITVIEPDPLARWLLRARFPKVRSWTMLTQCDWLPWFTEDRARFAQLLQTHEDHAVLFSNLLGQIALLVPRPLAAHEWDSRHQEFLTALEGRSWASYHDLFSAHAVSTMNEPAVAAEFACLGSGARVAEKVWQNETVATEVIDHGTDWLRSQRGSLWRLRAGTTHLIGFTFHNVTKDDGKNAQKNNWASSDSTDAVDGEVAGG